MALRLVVLIALLIPCRAAFAWGTTAHRVVARIAAADLPPDVNAGIKTLLGNDTLVTVSTMPDTWGSSRPESRIWHFVDIPLREKAYSRSRDCKNECLVGALQRFGYVLGARSEPDEDRREALIYLVHLVADAHQPLHTADNGDRAANMLKIRYRNVDSNLHSYWDTTVIQSRGESEDRYAQRLIAEAKRRDAAQLQKGTFESWVNESHALAGTVYKIPASKTLDASYETWSRKAADEQLIKAGLRLRGLLVKYFSGYGR
ncbi:MAG TPA: S1/P1 nuclease [Thermoanaerobaculia bacterium]|nr:S1/P1 nuclease [Thermoanaerobaculia bacterium]